MDTIELKKEQERLARKVELRDTFDKISLVGAVECAQINNELRATIVVLEFPSFKIIETRSYVLHNPLPFKQGFQAYREMPAIIEAFNQLNQEPELLLVKGRGINHPRRMGIATHLGLVLNLPVIGISDKLICGKVENGKIINNSEIVGFEITTKEFANPIYVSPGNNISLGSALSLISKMIIAPHKMPEPLHIARKISKKENLSESEIKC